MGIRDFFVMHFGELALFLAVISPSLSKRPLRAEPLANLRCCGGTRGLSRRRNLPFLGLFGKLFIRPASWPVY